MQLRIRSIFYCLAMATSTLTLVACGGGGGSDATTVGNTDESVADDGDDSTTDGNPLVGAPDGGGLVITPGDSTGDNAPGNDAVVVAPGDSTNDNASEDDSVDVTTGDSTGDNAPGDDAVVVTPGDSTNDNASEDESVDVTTGDSTGDNAPDNGAVVVAPGDSTGDNASEDDSVDVTSGDSTGDNAPNDDAVVVAPGDSTATDDSTGDGASIVDEGVNDDNAGMPVSSPRIELDGSIYQTTDSFGTTHLFGMLKNTGGSDAVFVKVRCSFFSADSALVAERLSYVKGTNVVLTSINATTNTALKPGESGVFEVTPYIDSDEFSTYQCNYSYDTANNTRDPDARMELVGTINVQESYFGNVEYLGQVKNTGTKGLVFGKLYFITRDTANSIIDVSLTFVHGDTVTLSLIDTATDTALKVGSTGTFSAYTGVPFSDYGQHSVMFAWEDSEITDDIAQKSDRSGGQVMIDTESKERTKSINKMRDAYLAN